MDLKHINAFAAVYEEGSINKAAQRLRSAQPSVSVLIKNLELDLGTALFERKATGTIPTLEADTLYVHFQKVLAELDAARKSINGTLDQYSGPLRVGLAPTVTKGVIPSILPKFLADYPNIDLRLTEGFSGKLIEWTLAGEVDFSLVVIPPNDRRLITRRIASEPVVLISGKGNGRQNLGQVDLTAGPPLKLVLPWGKHSLRGMLDRFIEAGSIPVARTVEMDTLWGMLDLVQRSDWVTLLSITAISGDLSGYMVQEVTEPAMTVEFYQIQPARGTLSAGAKKFTEQLEDGFSKSALLWKQALESR